MSIQNYDHLGNRDETKHFFNMLDGLPHLYLLSWLYVTRPMRVQFGKKNWGARGCLMCKTGTGAFQQLSITGSTYSYTKYIFVFYTCELCPDSVFFKRIRLSNITETTFLTRPKTAQLAQPFFHLVYFGNHETCCGSLLQCTQEA